MKLTKAQLEWLRWVESAGGVTDVSDRRIAAPLERLGLAEYDSLIDNWRITSAGRAQLATLKEPRHDD